MANPCFFPAIGDWVAVFPHPRAPKETDPWIVESVIGWLLLTADADGIDFACVTAGESISVSQDFIGVYRAADIETPHVRARLLEICESMRRRYGATVPA